MVPMFGINIQQLLDIFFYFSSKCFISPINVRLYMSSTLDVTKSYVSWFFFFFLVFGWVGLLMCTCTKLRYDEVWLFYIMYYSFWYDIILSFSLFYRNYSPSPFLSSRQVESVGSRSSDAPTASASLWATCVTPSATVSIVPTSRTVAACIPGYLVRRPWLPATVERVLWARQLLAILPNRPSILIN